MEQSSQDDVKAVFAKETWTLEDYDQLLQGLADANDAAGRLRASVAEVEAQNPEAKGAAAVKVGIGRYMTCRFAEALDALAQGTDNRDRHYFQGLCLMQLRQYDKAVAEFEPPRTAAWKRPSAT